jgi:hypothetical protein
MYNYLCNQCLSPLMLWVRISIRVRCTTLCDKYCQWLATGRWFSLGTPVYSTNKNWPPQYNWNIDESDVKHHPSSKLEADYFDLTELRTHVIYDSFSYLLWFSLFINRITLHKLQWLLPLQFILPSQFKGLPKKSLYELKTLHTIIFPLHYQTHYGYFCPPSPHLPFTGDS